MSGRMYRENVSGQCVSVSQGPAWEYFCQSELEIWMLFLSKMAIVKERQDKAEQDWTGEDKRRQKRREKKETTV